MTVTSVNASVNILKDLEDTEYAKGYLAPRYDMKIGMLVFVKTKNQWQNHNGWYQQIGNIPLNGPNLNPPSITPTPWNGYPFGNYPHTGIGGGTYIPHSTPTYPGTYPDNTRTVPWEYDNTAREYYYDVNASKNYTLSANQANPDQVFAETFEVRKSTIDDLKEMLTTYESNYDPNKLGMSMMRAPKKLKLNYKIQGINSRKQTTQNQNINTTTTAKITINGPLGSVSTNTILINSNNTGVPNQLEAVGYKTIKDYYKKNSTNVVQEEQWTNEEIAQFNKSGFALLSGKPFNGIIVDKFVPKMKSERGESIEADDLNMPVLYKVLFGEKNILWFEEGDLLPMKPKDCLKHSEK